MKPKLRLVMTLALVVFLLAGVNVVVAASSGALERRRETRDENWGFVAQSGQAAVMCWHGSGDGGQWSWRQRSLWG
jgi:hypothetical protein